MIDHGEIDAWIESGELCAADVAERAYKIARESHRGQLPKHLKRTWQDLPKPQKETFIFIAEHAMQQTNV